MVKRSFNDPTIQGSFADDAAQNGGYTGPVECLGMTFENDDARHAYFLDKLREKLQDPEFRKMEGFPIGKDEDILALSDPPYYTACPNPFIEDFIRHYGRPYDPNEPYHREPFAADVSEGKNDPIYLAHSYHTKVPHKAIMRYIIHYTKPGDIVLDGFCGTGMTGVAAQLCGKPDPEFRQKIEQEWKEAGWGEPEWGARRAILGDLSPAATLIAYNYNTPVDIATLERVMKRILVDVENEWGWMYQTHHHTGSYKGHINYTVWSSVLICPECAAEFVFWNVAVNRGTGEVLDEFLCPNCKIRLTKQRVERAWNSNYDARLRSVTREAKSVPVLINYSATEAGGRFEKKPADSDLTIIQRTKEIESPYWYPTNQIISGDEIGRLKNLEIISVDQLMSRRNNIIIGALLSKVVESRFPGQGRFLMTAALPNLTWMYRWRANNKGGSTSGTYYIGSTPQENSPFNQLARKLTDLLAVLSNDRRSAIISTHSSTQLQASNNSVDYIFTDPPFGANLMYSELNFLWESWLRILTNNKLEAIENRTQQKGLLEYQRIMEDCFREYWRVLKPGRWMTVEFSNTRAAVWNAIQTALEQAGFVVANVAALNKQQGSFKAVTTRTAVKQDLVISCYKPNDELEIRIKETQGSEIGVWEFIQAHMGYLPTFVSSDNQALEIVERTPRVLYDRVVAYFVQNGYPVPISSQEFQGGLAERFPARDSMYFLPGQVAEYERKRMSVREVQQLQLFVIDEASAIQWLRQQLTNKPQTFQEIHPYFIQELRAWQKHEVQLELSDLLEENFLTYEGEGYIPPQIVSWLKKSAATREMLETHGHEHDDGSVETTNPQLKARARDRWYVPDPNQATDLEKLRLKGLLREFATYKEGKGRLKQFRTEAVRAGFAQAWGQKDYKTIVELAQRLPESVLQEDPALLMYYDNASLRVQA